MALSRDVAAAALGAAAICTLIPGAAQPHGYAGARFFPATILTDDPFVADELGLPTVTRAPPDMAGTQELDLDWDIAKRITPEVGISLGQGWKYLRPNGLPAVSGLSALHAGAQYQFFKDGPHEAIALVGLNATLGHTGRVQALGEPDFTTLTPQLNFGKGLGDLPESMLWLRPIAITGTLGIDFPTKTSGAGSTNPNNLNYGLAFQYSLEYLQHQVKDIGLQPPFDRLIPLVEVGFTTALNRGLGGKTVGTVQPGVIWAGKYVQIGAEAIIPVNRTTGHGFGGVVQLHFYLDDLFPGSLGRPIFGD